MKLSFVNSIVDNFQGEDKYKFENKNPFVQNEEETEVASVGYRYVY